MAKAIIKIDVDSGAFDAHVAAFKKYRTDTIQSISDWGAVGKSIKSSGEYLQKVAKNSGEAFKNFKNASGATAKMQLSLKAADRTMTHLVSGAVKLGKNVLSTTKSLMSWAGIAGAFSTILAGGTFFGMGSYADKMSRAQQQSRETGAGFGQTRAAGIVYGQLLGGEGGVQALLDKIAVAQAKGGLFEGGGSFAAMGIKQKDWMDKTAGDVLPLLLKAAKELHMQAVKTNKGTQGYIDEAYGLTNLFSHGQLRSMGKTDLPMLDRRYGAESRALNMSEGAQSGWANFDRWAKSFGERAIDGFMSAISPLRPAIQNLSEGVLKAFSTLTHSDFAQRGMKAAGEAANDAAKYLVSPKFKKDVDDFFDSLDRAGGALWQFFDSIGGMLKKLGIITPSLGMSENRKYQELNAKASPLLAQRWRETALGNDVTGRGISSLLIEHSRSQNKQDQNAARLEANALLGTSYRSRDIAEEVAKGVRAGLGRDALVKQQGNVYVVVDSTTGTAAVRKPR